MQNPLGAKDAIHPPAIVQDRLYGHTGNNTIARMNSTTEYHFIHFDQLDGFWG
jgi:hypothetical protein